MSVYKFNIRLCQNTWKPELYPALS